MNINRRFLGAVPSVCALSSRNDGRTFGGVSCSRADRRPGGPRSEGSDGEQLRGEAAAVRARQGALR